MYRCRQHTRTTANPTLSLPTGFLTCHLSYDHRTCHYRSLRVGWGLLFTILTLIHLEKRHFVSMSASIDTWLFRYRNSKRKIFVLRYYAPYYCAERNDCVHSSLAQRAVCHRNSNFMNNEQVFTISETFHPAEIYL